MTPAEINAASKVKLLEFGAKQDKDFVIFIKSVLAISEPAQFKIDVIQRRIDSDREAFHSFECSLEWEDE